MGLYKSTGITLEWRHNARDSVSNHQPHDCLLNRCFRQIKENIKAPRHWPLRGNSSETGEFPAQMASNAENASIWWRHHSLLWNRFRKFVQRTAVSLPCSVQNFRAIWLLELVFWANETSRDDEIRTDTLQQHPVLCIHSDDDSYSQPVC